MPDIIDTDNLFRKTSGKWPDILMQHGVSERAVSGKHGPCPMCGGEDRFRMISNEGNARWVCNQCGTGDGMDLLMATNNLSFIQAKELVDPIACTSKYAKPLGRVNSKEKRRMQRMNADTWKEANPRSTVLRAYMESRGIKHWEGADIRMHHSLMFYDDDRKPVKKMECMLARIATRDGKLACLHRTYLHLMEDGSYRTKKKMTKTGRDWKGGCVRLFPTKGSDTLIVAEGIETALSLRDIYSHKNGELIPCWAAISAGAMERMAVPESIKKVIIGCDNDANFTGQKAAYTLANRLAVQDKREVVVAVAPRVGTDWNDYQKGERS